MRSYSSVQCSCSVMSNSLWPHGLQPTRLPCPSPTPGACSNSFPLNQWCHPTILSSVIPSPPAFNLSQYHGLFQWVSIYFFIIWLISLSISPPIWSMLLKITEFSFVLRVEKMILMLPESTCLHSKPNLAGVFFVVVAVVFNVKSALHSWNKSIYISDSY